MSFTVLLGIIKFSGPVRAATIKVSVLHKLAMLSAKSNELGSHIIM